MSSAVVLVFFKLIEVVAFVELVIIKSVELEVHSVNLYPSSKFAVTLALEEP